jgi:RHS repeat-associated protein
MDQRLDSGYDQFRYPTNSNTFYNVYWIKDSTAAKHQLGYDTTNLQLLRSTDGTGLLHVPVTTPPDTPFVPAADWDMGTTYTPAGVQHIHNSSGYTIEDPDGNSIVWSGSQITDSLGRTIPSGPPASTSSITGCPAISATYQPTSGSASWTIPGPNSSQVTYLFCYASVHFHTNLACTGTLCSDASGTVSVIQSVVLPNGTYWAFIYDAANPSDNTSVGYAQVTQVRLPTGGTINYQYQTFKPSCAPPKTPNFSRSVVQHTFDPGNGSPMSTWTYRIGYPSGSNTLTDPLGNDTVYTFSTFGGCDAHETQEQAYQGSQTTGKLLRTKATAYQYASNPQSGAFTGGGGTNNAVFTSKITTTLDSGQSTATSYSYDNGFSNVQPACTAGANNSFSCTNSSPVQTSFGRQTYSTVVDYSGSALKTIQTTYLFQLNGSYYSANFLDAVSSSYINGSLAQTAYGYDENNGSPQGVLAHQTSISRWLNTTGSNLTTQRVYNKQGMVTQLIDPLSNVTKYTYDSTGAFLSQVQRPDTVSNGITTHHIANYVFDPVIGRPLTYTDENSNQTAYSYDNMRRLTTTNYPDGGQTIYCYTDSGGSTCSQTAPPYKAVTSKKITSSLMNTSTALVDGLGRLTQTQINSDPDGTTYQPTVYDLMNRPSQVYNPTRCNPPTTICGESTWGYTSYGYDGLGRTATVTEQDGSPIVASYSGNCTTVTDEAGKSRKSCADALGRLTQVFEDPSGLNYETDYQYDALGNLLRVDQKGGTTDSTKWRTRYFMYDSLSRLISSFNPESGGANFTYDNNSNVLTKTANSTSQSLTITGAEQTTTVTTCIIDQITGECKPGTTHTTTYYDTGTVSVSLNSFTKSVTYGQGSTSSTVASALASAFNGDSTSPVTASASNNILTLTAKSASSPVYYAVSTTSATTNTKYFSVPSFSGQISALSLTADGNGLVTNYTYDALNRLTQKSYSDGVTPTVKYGYDAVSPAACTPPALAITNGIGRRTSMCDGAGAEVWSYDKMGRTAAEMRSTNSVSKATSYTYNLDGSLATLTYPSGRVITYTPSAAGRPLSAVDQANAITYATAAHYSPAGALAALTNGTNLNSTYIFNSRLQPCWMYATTATPLPWNTSTCTTTAATGTMLDLKYNFNSGAGDNGNIMGIANNRDATRSESFTYDALNRIATAQTQTTGVTIPNSNCWGLTFGYDAWGNLQQASTTGPAGCAEPLPLNVSANSSNQISGYCYDAAGNLLAQSAPPCSVATYGYNAENQMTATGGVNYSYDGDGRRVMKSSGAIYWYGAGSGPLDETDLAGATSNSTFHEYVFFSGKRIARRDSSNNVNYYFADHLGTSRIVTSATGTILDDSDFYPFGGERPILSSSGNHFKFTGKEHDSESGLDNFGARYSASNLGRFNSPDPSGLSIDRLNPQSWNRYAYTYNNPLRFVDHNGKWPTDVHNQIIDAAFPGLSAQQRNELKRISAWVDRIPGGQTKAHNHEHAMRSPGENPAAARRAIDQNIQNHERAAQQAQGGTPDHASQINNRALDEFGQALHTTTDRTSPAHTDASGNPREWNGIPVTPEGKQAVEQHMAEEAHPTPEQFEGAVVAAQQALKNTFGDAAFQDATTIPTPPEAPRETQCTMGDPEEGCGAKVTVGSNNPH